MGDGRAPVWKVGELARRTGLSVRALHHYDEIGLLSASGRTEAGHRIYGAGDVARLQRIQSLKALGFGLEEARELLGREKFSALEAIELHISRLKESIELQEKLCGRLEAVAARVRSGGEIPTEEFVETAMEVIEMSEKVDKYYSREQLEYLGQRRREFGEERIRRFEAEWEELIGEVRAEKEAGTDPSDEKVRRLARRWMELVGAFTGGDPGVERSLGDMWQQEDDIHGHHTSEMREMMEYISRAMPAPDERE